MQAEEQPCWTKVDAFVAHVSTNCVDVASFNPCREPLQVGSVCLRVSGGRVFAVLIVGWCHSAVCYECSRVLS
jgi:hypothetical protein